MGADSALDMLVAKDASGVPALFPSCPNTPFDKLRA